MRPLLFIVAVLAVPAWADETERAAEYERISTNMVRLAERNSWDGVEAAFEQLVSDKHEIRGGEWIIGAQSARKLGDVALVVERLEAAKLAGEDDQAGVWLTTIHENYRPVVLQAKSGTVLSTDNRPFNPDYVVAIDFAADQVDRTGKFSGWLPHWTYELGAESFELAPGDEAFVLDVRKLVVEEPAVADITDATGDLAEAVSIPADATLEERGGAGWARIPLLGGAAASMALSATYYAAGAQRHRAWQETDDVDQTFTLRHEANTYAQWSAIAAGAAVGLGVTGALVGPKNSKTRSPR